MNYVMIVVLPSLTKWEQNNIENAFLTKYVPMYILKKEGALINYWQFLSGSSTIS